MNLTVWTPKMSLFFIGFFIFDTSFRTTHIDQDVRPTNLWFKFNTCTHALIIFIFSLTELVSIIHHSELWREWFYNCVTCESMAGRLMQQMIVPRRSEIINLQWRCSDKCVLKANLKRSPWALNRRSPKIAITWVESHDPATATATSIFQLKAVIKASSYGLGQSATILEITELLNSTMCAMASSWRSLAVSAVTTQLGWKTKEEVARGYRDIQTAWGTCRWLLTDSYQSFAGQQSPCQSQ